MTLAILSENVDCFNIVFHYVDTKNINNNCLSKSGKDQTFFNKHRKFTPLTIACYKGFSAAIRKLVEKGSEVNIRDQNGSMPLVLACRFGFYSDCMYLVNNGADLNCSNENGITPLIAATMSRNNKIVTFLASVNICDNEGKSPLYWAAQNGFCNIGETLVNKEADINQILTGVHVA